MNIDSAVILKPHNFIPYSLGAPISQCDLQIELYNCLIWKGLLKVIYSNYQNAELSFFLSILI